MVDVLAVRGQTIQSLGRSLSHGASGMARVPDLLRIVLTDESWREFTIMDKHVVHDSFASFVTRPPLDGLGAESVEQLKRLVADDDELRRLIRKATEDQGHRSDLRSNRTEVRRSRGTTVDYARQRLHDQAPELYAKVLAHELSPHAAMVQAGFRPKTFTIRADDIAGSLRRRLTPKQLAALKDEL